MRVCAVSSCSVSKTVMTARVLRKPVGEIRRDAKLVGELDQQRAKVERDDAALGLQEPGLVVEHPDDLLLRDPECGDPELLEARPVEDPECETLGQGPHCARDRAGERLLVRGQPLLEGRLHVDLVKSWSVSVAATCCLDVVVGDELARGLLELAPVERLALDEVGDDGDDDEEHAEHGEYPCKGRPPPSGTALSLVHALTSSVGTVAARARGREALAAGGSELLQDDLDRGRRAGPR